jgi:hypothetical protein
MYVLFVLAMLQAQPAAPSIVVPRAPATTITKNPQEPPVITSRITNSSGGIREDQVTEMTHAQMERDIGTQSADIGTLKSQVKTLEDLRKDPDRKDIDDLKDSRNHIVWTWGIFSTIVGTLAAAAIGLYVKFKDLVWEDSIKPRLKKYLIELTQ